MKRPADDGSAGDPERLDLRIAANVPSRIVSLWGDS